LDYFERHKAEYLACFPGLFVLIKDDRMHGPFPTAEEAYEEGLREHGLVPFLVRQVLKQEPVNYVPISFVSRPADAGL